MAAVFLALFPTGVVLMRSGNRRAFAWHWQIQIIGIPIMLVGVVSGVLMKKKINTVHQGFGIVLAVVVVLQAGLGWRHHVDFLRIRSRTWISHAHTWTGRGMMFGGWNNLVTGMVLRRWEERWIGAMAILVVLDAIVLSAPLWWLRKKQASTAASQAKYNSVDDSNDSFTVGEDEELELDEKV